MKFFIAMKPPTATAQEKQVSVVHGRPVFYDPAPVKEAKNQLNGHLIRHKPDEPMKGPVQLRTIWLFPKGKSHKNGEWRVTRPDAETLQAEFFAGRDPLRDVGLSGSLLGQPPGLDRLGHPLDDCLLLDKAVI